MKTIASISIAATLAGATVAQACTSWVIRPELTESGMMIAQKILDNPYRSRLDADIRVAANGWRWIRVGSFVCGASMAMNEKGVAITTNCGDRNGEVRAHGKERQTVGCYELVWLVKSCATAEEAVDAIKHIARNRLFIFGDGTRKYGTILLVADPRRAFMVEIGDGYAEATEITSGMHVVANSWMLPGGEEFSEFDLPWLRSDRARQACTIKALQEGKANGKYTVRGCFDTSRMIRGPKFNQRYPFVPGSRKPKNMSLETTCFEIDPEFTAYLSCAYISLGPQRHTVYLPVSMAVRQLPDKMRDGRWAEMAYSHQEAFGPNHGDMEKITALEDKFLAEFKTVRAEARKLLREGKKDEAVKLLNDCFDRQYAEADKLMSALYDAAKKKLAASKTEAEKK